MECQRCGNETKAHTVSMFNTQTICLECKAIERTHPRYEEACKAELEAVRNGDYNFPGIGWDGDKK